MQQFEITIPQLDNAGQSAISAHERYRAHLLAYFGGYTFEPVTGAWQDKTGRVYRDASWRYMIAVRQRRPRTNIGEGLEYTHPDYVEALTAARLLFPDRLAFYWAWAGECEVTNADDI